MLILYLDTYSHRKTHFSPFICHFPTLQLQSGFSTMDSAAQPPLHLKASALCSPPQTSHVAAWSNLMNLGVDGTRKRSRADQSGPMTQRVHPIPTATSLVPQAVNNSSARWQASITAEACFCSLHKLKQPGPFLTMQTCCSQTLSDALSGWLSAGIFLYSCPNTFRNDLQKSQHLTSFLGKIFIKIKHLKNLES